MKDRKFWEDLINVAQSKCGSLEPRIRGLNSDKKRRIRFRSSQENRSRVQKLESRIAYLIRLKAYWDARIDFYQGRIRALQRTRYQRILRTPVI